MRSPLLSVVSAVSVAALLGCGSSQPKVPESPPAAPATPEAEAPAPASEPAPANMSLAESGIVPEWLDRSADPCKDFFEHACGTFVKTAVIPPDRSSWSSIEVVNKDAEDFLHEVLEKAAKDPGSHPTPKVLGDYYAACMDEAAIDKNGLAALAPQLQKIAAVKDAASARDAVIELQAASVSPFFSLYPLADYGDATQVIASLDQGGLGLPDRDYYLKDEGNMKAVRATYRAHVARVLALAGMKTGAADVWRIELALAKLSQDKVVRRNPHAFYHKIDLAGVEKAAPSFPWKELLSRLGIGGVTAITVNDPKYFTGMARLLDKEKPAALRAYLTFHLIDTYDGELGKAFVDEGQVMNLALNGVKEVPPRWRRCLDRVDRDLGELLGQAYVAARFAGDAKARAVDLTKAILAAMAVEIDGLPWMDEPTRVAARKKLDKMGYLVGYPETWRKYDFEVTRADHTANATAAIRFELARQLAKIGKPVDRTDWSMTPPTVNAYYEPTLNQMALPAGQLQPPFFGPKFHPAINFGGTGGATIGHEMTHGFDDEGSQFDADGNLQDWWSKPTKEKFDAATQCVVAQYGKYEAVPGVKLNGALTAGENIADIGGVKIGFHAYQAWKAKQTPPPPAEVDGYTDEQLYFLAYGQSWCSKATPESLETRAHSNPHSPPRWRVNGVVVDLKAFADAFKCPVGSPMNPGNVCTVW